MRSDLRKLLARHRAGLTRRAVLEEAVDEACSRLVAERFGQDAPGTEGSPLVQAQLSRFEDRVAHARQWIPAGQCRRAVQAVEEAEKALLRAREIARAAGDLQEARSSWHTLVETFGLEVHSELATVRVAERSLAVAEAFLESGEPRKARLVTRQLRVGLERLRQRQEDPVRRRELVRRLVGWQRGDGARLEGVVSTAGRLADAGLLELAQRLVEDWWAAEGAAGPAETQGGSGTLPVAPDGTILSARDTRFGEIEQEASRLAAVLEEIGAERDPAARSEAATKGMETEVE